MAARAIWKAVLRSGDIDLPVKLYSAVEDRSVRFHLLHDQDKVRVQQRLVDSATDKPVTPEEVRKGYEVERDLFVLLEPDELEGLQPKASRNITLTRFVDSSTIPHQYYARPYWLGPDSRDVDYFAFAQTLEREKQTGVARWVMRGKRYVGALRAVGGYLSLVTLLFAEEVINSGELTPPSGRELDRKELALAQQLIAALKDDFDPTAFQDEYRGRVLDLIEAKRAGKTIKVQSRPRKSPEKSLLKSLQASLKSVG